MGWNAGSGYQADGSFFHEQNYGFSLLGFSAMLKRYHYYYYVNWFSTVFFILIAGSVSGGEFPHCNCDDEGGLWSIQNILEYQKASDFLIAVAYFSIPIELLYFITCSNVPFKWVLVQFTAFIVLCGITHLFNGWTYYGPHSFQLMMTLTVFKILTALVSCATAITLFTFIPLLLKFKVRELFLKQNVLELNQEVGFMKKQKEASLHVRMLTQEIRKSLDKHTILYTTLVQLSRTLDLHNCAVWMPSKTKMNLAYELKARVSSKRRIRSLPIEDPDVIEIRKTKGVRILRSDSALAAASRGGDGTVTGGAAAIRMPMLRVSDFKMPGGTSPEFVETSYALLVLILRSENKKGWSNDEMEIVGVVADQVAVALSHASVLEESQFMRERLEERNRLLQQAKEEAMMANKARNAFQKVMSRAMRKPMHSISGLLSIFDNASAQRVNYIVETIVRTSSVLSTLINDAVEISAKDEDDDVGRFPLEARPFELHPMIKEACCMIKCLCICKGFGFFVDVQNSLPNRVTGDDGRTFQVLLHMVGHLLDVSDATGGSVIFRVASDSTNTNARQGIWKHGNVLEEQHVSIKFELEITDRGVHHTKEDNVCKKGLSFRLCKKLVQMMQGNIWISNSKQGHHTEIMTLVLKFQIQPFTRTVLEFPQHQPRSNSSMFMGLRVLVADEDDVNRFVTRKLLEKLGCLVSVVGSGSECLIRLGSRQTSFEVILLDIHMPDMDGFELAMKIQRFRSRNCPLIIAVAASEEEQLWEKCVQAKMNGLLRKPVDLQQIADELCRAIQRANEVV